MPDPKTGNVRRDLWLDILRAIAVIGVIGTHLKLPVHSVPTLLEAPLRLWKQGGWVGVDLFFVLSGFLVSGLLFKELIENGNVSVGRFLVRRGFKIYPPFWLVLSGIIAARLILHSPISAANVIGELLFLQNYVGKLSGTHWTLAIEEHFYLLLAFWFWLQMRGKVLSKKEILRRFRYYPLIYFIAALVCLMFRLAYINSSSYSQAIFMTHLRIDALLFGSLLSWFWHLEGMKLTNFRFQHRVLFTVIGIIFLLPPFILDENNRGWAFQLFCFNGFYLGSGLLILAGYGLEIKGSLPKLVARIGSCSYGIYLCHDPLQRYLLFWILDLERSCLMWYLYLVSYLVGSCIIGIWLTRLVERPSLILRDRLFPSNVGRCY